VAHPAILAHSGDWGRRVSVQSQSERHSETVSEEGRGACDPSGREALSSNPITAKKINEKFEAMSVIVLLILYVFELFILVYDWL
jgi:hypothetical protein